MSVIFWIQSKLNERNEFWNKQDVKELWDCKADDIWRNITSDVPEPYYDGPGSN